MKIKLLVILIIGLTQLLPVQAQSPEKIGLLLNGTIVNATRRDFNDHAEWSYKLLMVLRNDGNRPVILYKDCFADWLGGSCETKIDFLYCGDRSDARSVEEAERTVFSRTYPVRLIAQFWPRVVNGLNQRQPPQGVVFTIDPGRTFEFSQTLEVKEKFWSRGEGKKKTVFWESLEHEDGDTTHTAIPLSGAEALRISYRFSPMEPDTNADSFYEPGDSVPVVRPYKDPDFLGKLSERWREFGIFPIDSSGAFSITSERIINGSYQHLK